MADIATNSIGKLLMRPKAGLGTLAAFFNKKPDDIFVVRAGRADLQQQQLLRVGLHRVRRPLGRL